MQPLDLEVGAGTFHPATFLKSIGKQPFNCAFVQPCRRPTDGRYGVNPNRLQHYYQFQVMMKPVPTNFQELYLKSLATIGIDNKIHDIRFVEDNWESPTLGAWGLGWEVWLNGMEITQFTYFQQVGGLQCKPITGEITYGLERIAMYLQNVDSVYDIIWHKNNDGSVVNYGDIFQQNEVEMSKYNFEVADVNSCQQQFQQCRSIVKTLVEKQLPLPAYEQVIKASHLFNLLDARNAISITERQDYILKVRQLAQSVAQCYYQSCKHQDIANTVNSTVSTQNLQNIAAKNIVAKNIDKANNLLIEILCEELPPQSITKLATSFANYLSTQLQGFKRDEQQFQVFSTPVRIACILPNLYFKQKNTRQKITGAKKSIACDANGNPTKVGSGFIKKHNITWDKVKWNHEADPKLIIEKTVIGKTLTEVLPKIIADAIKQLPIGKRMRWEDNDFEFARPIKSSVVLFGEHTLNIAILNTVSSNTSKGHRTIANNDITIDNADEYENKLAKYKVVACAQTRKNIITEQLKKVGVTVDASLNDLLEAVTSLVELPNTLIGYFDEGFLKLPSEVLIETMQKHQKYFPIYQNNKLTNKFAFVANIDPEQTQQVIDGNQRVIAPRLKDSSFFYSSDAKLGLKHYSNCLKTITYQQGLGSIYDKAIRIAKIATKLNSRFNYQINADTIDSAAKLLKADLATNLVQELPNLQGIAGYYYALDAGIANDIAIAIKDHYLPVSTTDNALPRSNLAMLMAIADKLDTIVTMYIAGKTVSGSRDPFGLRRVAIGILRLIYNFKLDIDISTLFGFAIELWKDTDTKTVLELLQKFTTERAKTVISQIINNNSTISKSEQHWLNEQLSSLDSVDNFYALCTGYADLLQYRQQSNNKLQDLQNCAKRIKNILKQQRQAKVVVALLTEQSEIKLYELLTKSELADNLATLDYKQYFKQLELLAPVAEDFFNNVVIYHDQAATKNNRLALTVKLNAAFATLNKLLK